jgi:YVTN family beta-propeller protein
MLLGAVAMSLTFCVGETTGAESLSKQIRRPIAIVAAADQIVVANGRSGSLSIVNAKNGVVIAEHKIGNRIADMVELKSPKTNKNSVTVLLHCPDEMQLMIATLTGRAIKKFVIAKLANPTSTQESLAISGLTGRLATDGQQIYVSEKWARRIVCLSLDANFKQVTERKTLDLPFAPGEMQILPDAKSLIVADAFGGRMAIVDAKRMTLGGSARIDGHNIRGLAVSDDGERLLVAHQRMNPLARADYDDLHWGSLVSNGVRVIDVAKFDGSADQNSTKLKAEPSKDSTQEDGPKTDGWLDHFGGTGNATGDPSGVITGSNDLMAVTLGGIGEVIIRRAGYSTRIRVGRRPEAMAVHGGRLYVANRFDDSISCIDLDVGKVIRTVLLGSTAELQAADRGELLFFDAKLSHDGWMSCHSCHTDGHSSGLLIDTLGDGDYGAPKRIPSLLGTRGTGPWAWNGAMMTLAAQVKKSVTTTMHGEPLTDQQTSDIVAFLESLKSPPPALRQASHLQAQGRSVFESKGCHNCHAGTKLTIAGTFDVGLLDEHKNRLFNPPSLRGVSQRTRLFHDGRARNVDDVVLRFEHKLAKPLSKAESSALLSYLKSL